jgi:Mg2+ and Co2+ transporter CorA
VGASPAPFTEEQEMSNAYLEDKLDRTFDAIESVRARVRRQEDVTLADEDEMTRLEEQRDRLLKCLRP